MAIPAGVTPPGVPLTAAASGAIVHASLYLDRTCRTQNVALYASDAVTLHADGTCNPVEGGDPVLTCSQSPVAIASDGGAEASAISSTFDASAEASTEGGSASVPIGQSTNHVPIALRRQPGRVRRSPAVDAGRFRVLSRGSARDVPGGSWPPPPCRGHLKGNFRFYFNRGSPAQPFP